MLLDKRSLWILLGAILVVPALSLGVRSDARPEPPPEPPRTREVAAGAATELSSPAPAPPGPSADELRAECELAIQAALAQPGHSGAGYEKKRAELIPRAKTEPVLFVRTPRAGKDGTAASVRSRLETRSGVWESLLRLLPEFEKKPEFGRSVLLREGYLYAERADLAFSIVQLVRADHLFDEPRIWVERGETLMHAELRGKRYVYVDGPHSGEPVRLLHFDRVGSGERSVAVHRDVRSLRYRLHFDRMQVAHMTDDHIVADLVYGKVTVRSLIRSAGARLELECEIVPHDERAAFARARELNRRQQRVLSVLRATILEQIDEGLPFDEPKTEIGQQDGKLRPHWRQAYLRGESKYKFNDDEYKVFDKHGRPRVPQVCVDFVTDTLERSSGTWWRAAGNAPERVVGRLDLHEIPGFPLRRSAELVRFAAKNSGMFEVDVTPERERIELGDKPRFFRWLARQGDRYRAGDIVFIRGYTPWDDQELHYHSFFVYETDPVTGVPISLAGNAGSPSLRSFEVEARRTPQRSVWYRIRPQLEWLESIVFDGEQPSQEVPTLVRG